MTAQEIIKTGFGLMFEDAEVDKKAARFSLDVLNVLVADCFDAEQNRRESEGQPLLEDVPNIRSASDDIPYHLRLVRITLPYGVAWKYAEENLNQEQAELYRMRYETERHNAGGGAWL